MSQRKVRVICKMPGAIIGELIPVSDDGFLRDHGGWDANYMVKEGFVVWVKEPKCAICNDTGKIPCDICKRAKTACATGTKCVCQNESLADKFVPLLYEHGGFAGCNAAAQIVKDHTLVVFDKAKRKFCDYKGDCGTCGAIRKDLEQM